jgi:hypothetical protein
MNKLHFCGGLPRSGSTVLMNILQQNPKISSWLEISSSQQEMQLITAGDNLRRQPPPHPALF